MGCTHTKTNTKIPTSTLPTVSPQQYKSDGVTPVRSILKRNNTNTRFRAPHRSRVSFSIVQEKENEKEINKETLSIDRTEIFNAMLLNMGNMTKSTRVPRGLRIRTSADSMYNLCTN